MIDQVGIQRRRREQGQQPVVRKFETASYHLAVLIDLPERDALRDLAGMLGRPMSEVARGAILQFLHAAGDYEPTPASYAGGLLEVTRALAGGNANGATPDAAPDDTDAAHDDTDAAHDEET